MPFRETVFVNGEIYHIFNHAVYGQPIFKFSKDCQRALTTISFYKRDPLPVSLSHYLKISDKEKETVERLLKKSKIIVKVLCFCLMSNHFHFLLKQKKNQGISKFLANFQNSYTKYFNIRHSRSGHLFQGQFKAVRMETEEQLLHVSRYIHLNPYSSYLVKNFDALKNYSWSSLGEYLNLFDHRICTKKILLSFFKTLKSFEDFIFNQKDYQRDIQNIKHLLLE